MEADDYVVAVVSELCLFFGDAGYYHSNCSQLAIHATPAVAADDDDNVDQN